MRILLFTISLFLSACLMAQEHRCATMDVFNRRVAQRPELLVEREELEAFTKDYIDDLRNNGALGEDAVVTIPVVVHVVYKTAAQNISDAQIYSQIDVLTNDYRRKNADSLQTPSAFKSLAGDMEIEFCLAAVDPWGNPTNGITRTATTVTNIGNINNDNIYFSADGGYDAWNTSKYLNIWVCQLSTGLDVLGYSNLPSGSPDPDFDGLVIDYRCFGTLGTAVFPFNKGRTATHEIGHFFNLLHPWGNNADNPTCNQDDGVSDTPKTDGPFYGCPGGTQTSCTTSAMYMNYMDYVDDRCMNLFSKGQKTRLQASLNSNARKNMKNAVACSSTPTPVVDNPFESVKFEMFPNPATEFVNLSISAPARIKMQAKILDIMGHTFWESEMETGTRNWLIDVKNMPVGVYFFQMSYEGQNKTGKFLVYHP